MAQLTALDAGFLKSRDPERHPGLAIGAVAVVNGVAPSYDQLKTVLTERIKSIPRCTQVLATEWIDYPGFDLTQHVRRVALPRPGDEAELFRAIALALERPLDPDRPLWECWIIEGLNGNRWAILIKIHHCMAGAMSAAHLLARLCDDADGSAFANNVDIKQIPPYGDARSWAETLWRMSVSIAGAVCTAAARAVSWPAVTSPAGPVTTRRRYQAVRVPRDAVDAVCHKFGVTANDVALASPRASERFCCTAASNRAPTHCVPWRKPMAARPCCPISPSSTTTRCGDCAPCTTGHSRAAVVNPTVCRTIRLSCCAPR